MGPHCNEIELPGLFLQDPLQLIRTFVLLSEFRLCFKSFPQPVPVLRFVSFPQINNGLPNIVNVLSHSGLSMDICSISGAGTDWRIFGFHPCSECGPSRAFKDRKLSHSELSKNLLYPSYQLVPQLIGPTCPERSPSLGQAFLQARIIQFLRE